MKKKLSFLVAVILLVGILAIPTSAATPEAIYQTSMMYVEGYGEIEVETFLTVHDSLLRSSKKTANVKNNYKIDGIVIATVTFEATFGYDGSSAWVVSTSVTKSTSGGWTYGGQTIDKIGGTATLTARLTHSRYADIPIKITMTCSPTGKIS